MGTRSATKRDFKEELARVKRHIDQAVYELAEARAHMLDSVQPDSEVNSSFREQELATLCISLELSLIDSVAWAQRLAEKVQGSFKPAIAS